MKTKNLIQMQANVVKFTSLTKGNVIKILREDCSDIKPIYGVVLDFYNTGEKSFIEILEYEKSYGDIKGKIKVYKGDEDLNIFPASTDEVQDFLGEAVESARKRIEEKKIELAKLTEALGKAEDFVSGALSKELTEASFSEMSQLEYNNKKKELLELQGKEPF